MNQELLTRLFKSIEGDRSNDIVKVAFNIIEEERSKGHVKLAERLKAILEKNLNQTDQFKGELKRILPQGVSVPTDKRYNLPLATPTERTALRHEMVLSNSIEEKISRIEREYIARERLAKFGLTPRKKILFYGAPGCGKSMSAERIAWNIGLPFWKVRFEAIISSYLGESASNLNQLFEAIKNYPCVLLLDEFDIIAKARDYGQDVGEMNRVVNILLNLLEEYDAPGILIATTNLEGILDKALFRRFDDLIEIPKPGDNEIIELMKNSLSSIKTSKNIDWSSFSKQMNGFSAALVVKVMNDAAKLSIIGNQSEVSKEHLEKALNETKNYNA